MLNEPDKLRAALAGRYRIERHLGTGGMAVVYLADDLQRHRQVAIKVLRPELAAAVGGDRFLREIEISAHLTHPHLLPLYDSGEVDGLLYSVMPYVPGGSLRDRLVRERQLSIEDAVRVAREVADGLAYAHGLGIVHRDIKPENILFQADHAVISDFGVAQAISDAAGERLTGTGIALGTPIYMSPEQATGHQRLDGRSDIYSLGCMLYEMLAGDPPFTGVNPQAILTRKAVESPPSLRAVRDTVSEELERVILRALAKAPADRYATAIDFSRALELASLPGTPSRPSFHPSRRAKRFVLTGVLSLGVVAGSGWWAWNRTGARIDSLAVLPLHNLSGDQTQAYLVDAMHGAIIGELGQIGSLRTISQWSAMHYREGDKALPQIARELNVKALVEASVLITAESVRVQVELFQAVPEERRLWGHTYTSDRSGIGLLQTEVARGVASEVRAALTPQEKARLSRGTPINPDAYDAYARGELAYNLYTAAGFREAITHFETAIAKSPDYARAYAGLADAYYTLPYYAAVDPREAFRKSKAAAMKALELDESLAEAYSALAWTAATYDWDWEQAERYHRRAIELAPGSARGYMLYAHFLSWMGRFDEAIAQDLRARELDPLSPRIMAHVGLMYHLAGDYKRAIQLYQETIERNPGFARVRFDLGRAYYETGEYGLAVTQLREALRLAGPNAAGSATSPAELAAALAKSGRPGEAERILRELQVQRSRGYGAALPIARVYLALGDTSKVFDWLKLAFQERDADMILMKVLPGFKPVRGDPRFQDMLRRMHFPS